MSRLASMAVLVRVADPGSFAAAARESGISPAMVGNHVRALEAWLGAPLLLRTTRQQTLTDLGRSVPSRSRAPTDGMAEREAVAGRQDEPTGPLRIAAPLGTGRRHVAPAVHAFMALHPRLQVEIRLSGTVEDMATSDLDLAVRDGPLQRREPSLVARVVARRKLILAAAPRYLDQTDAPRTLDALREHRTVRHSRHGRPRGWLFPVTAASCEWTQRPRSWRTTSRCCSMRRGSRSASRGCRTGWSRHPLRTGRCAASCPSGTRLWWTPSPSRRAR